MSGVGEEDRLLQWAELIADATGSRYSTESSRQALDGVEPFERSPEAVIPFLDRLGVGVRTLQVSPEEALELVSPRHPVLWWAEGEQPELWLDRRGARVRVVQPGLAPRWRNLQSDGGRSLAWALSPEPVIKAWPKDGLLKRLWALLALEKADIQTVLLYALVTGVLSLTTPVAVQALISTLRLGTLLQPLIVLTVLLVAALSLSGVLRALEVHVVELMQRRLLVRVVSDLSYRMIGADRDDLRAQGGPKLMNRFFDLFLVHKALAFLLLDGVDLILRTGLGMMLLAFYHPMLLAFDVVLVIMLTALLLIPLRQGLTTGVKESKAKHYMAEWLEQVAEQNEVFRSTSGQRWYRDRIDDLSRGFLEHRVKHFRVIMGQTIGGLAIQALASGALLGLGGWLVMQGSLTLGQLVAAELIVTIVVSSVAKIGKQLESFYDLVASSDKLGQLLDLQQVDHRGALPAEDAPFEVRLKEVALVRGSTVVGRIDDLRVSSGERWAVLGPSGSGKSTLADAFFEPRLVGSGDLSVSGREAKYLDGSWLEDSIMVLRPQGWLRATIEENLLLGSSISDERVNQILDEVGLTRAVARLPRGKKEVLDDRGHPLARGEAIRLLVARVAFREPKLVFIDGLFDDLGDEDAQRLLDILHAKGRRTVIMATRNPDRAGWMDHTLVLGEDQARQGAPS